MRLVAWSRRAKAAALFGIFVLVGVAPETMAQTGPVNAPTLVPPSAIYGTGRSDQTKVNTPPKTTVDNNTFLRDSSSGWRQPKLLGVEDPGGDQYNYKPENYLITPTNRSHLFAGPVWANLPNRSYLSSSSNNSPASVSPDRNAFGGGISAEFLFDAARLLPNLIATQSPSTPFIGIGGFYSAYTNDSVIGTLNPGAGQQILIVSPQGGSLGAGLNNPVQNLRYESDTRRAGFQLKAGQTIYQPNATRMQFYSLFSYTRTSFDESFSGTFNSGNNTFQYLSDADVDTFGLHFGFGVSREIIVSGPRRLRVGLYGEAGPDFSHGHGNDSLSSTGQQTLTAKPSASRTGFSYKLGGNMELELPSDWRLVLNAEIARETAMPVFERSTANNTPTELRLLDGTVIKLMAGVTIPLGGVQRPETRYRGVGN